MALLNHEVFLEQLIGRLRAKGVACAIAGGLACVEYGVAQHTEDCDLICQIDGAGKLLALLKETPLQDAPCNYRGTFSPPLDSLWLVGGWTCHFEWPLAPSPVCLDLFGVPPRASTPWQADINGLFAGRSTLAEMKRTRRDQDWPQVTALGIQLLRQTDPRGWLHIFDEEMLTTLVEMERIPQEIIARRPVLALAAGKFPDLDVAIHTERVFWSQLDRVRLLIYTRALKPYASAVRSRLEQKGLPLPAQHEVRLKVARELLPLNPVRDYGLERFINEAREATAKFVRPEFLVYLPDVRMHFASLG